MMCALAKPRRVVVFPRRLSSTVPSLPEPAPASGSSGGFFAALLSASVGAAAGAAFSYGAFLHQQENLVERAELQRALGALRTESAVALVDYRSRVALLEHELGAIKRDIAAWGRAP